MSFASLVARYGISRSEPDALAIAATIANPIANPTHCHAVIAVYAATHGRSFEMLHA